MLYIKQPNLKILYFVIFAVQFPPLWVKNLSSVPRIHFHRIALETDHIW